MTDVLVVHPFRETRHQFWKEHFFMPERAVQVATYLDDQEGISADFVDFGQTTLDDENVRNIDAPRELKGQGWDFKRYGWSDDEIRTWLNNNMYKYNYFVVDALTPYFKDGPQFIVDYLDEHMGKDNVCMFGEWVGLKPEDFQDHVAVYGNWEAGLHHWINSMKNGGSIRETFGAISTDYPGKSIKYPYESDRFTAIEASMDDLPVPDWRRFVDMDDYPEPHCADYRAGRGCPEKCDFCHVAGIYEGRITGKSADTIIQDLKYLIEDEGFTKIKLRDDNFCVRAPVAYEVFKWIADNHPDVEILQPEGMEMKTAAHVEEVIEQMGRCNYHSVRVGFETIAEGNFQKNALGWWEQAHENFREAGFGPGEIVTFVMRGHPKLERTDEIDTAIYLSDYDVTLLSGGYRLVPGTELWDERETEESYYYGHGLPQEDPDGEIQKLGRLYRTVSAWNEWDCSLFHDDDPVKSLADVSWVDEIEDYGDSIRVRGTVSGWTRTDGIEDGLAIVLASRGYHKHKMVENTKRVMEIRGIKGHNPWIQKVLDRAEKQGMEVQDVGGLL